MAITKDETELEKKQLILPVFEEYQKARLKFAQSISDLAANPSDYAALKAAGAIPLLCTLFMDIMPSIQRTAIVAMGRLASYNIDIAEEIIRRNILPLLVEKLKKESNRITEIPNSEQLYKRAASYLLRSIAKHDVNLAKIIVKTNALEALQICIKDPDPLVKESAILTLTNIAKHSEELAIEIASEKYEIIPMLIQSIHDYDLPVLRAVASVIFEISKHSFQLALILQRNEIIPALEKLIEQDDPKLMNILLPILTQLSRYEDNFAMKLATEIHSIETAIKELSNEDISCRKNCCVYLLECVKHSDDLAQKVIDEGGISKMIEYIKKHEQEYRIPGITFLCNLAIRNEAMAGLIITEKALEVLCLVLESDPLEELKEIVVKTLGYLGSYNTKFTREITKTDAIFLIASLAANPVLYPEIKSTCNKSLKRMLKYCMHLRTLEKIMDIVQDDILELVLLQFAKILRVDGKLRRRFIISGTFKKVEEMKFPPGSKARNAIKSINLCFPPDLIRYYATDYLDELLLKVENFEPSTPPPSEQSLEISFSQKENMSINEHESINEYD
ncbi:sperm-associated antigen 6-like [Centruroides vittatus]|uniref:sperm-associated antigen 6-like n=1 Tax=Centruroides vittatus TaxID=120091 RepID=UPI00350EC9EC